MMGKTFDNYYDGATKEAAGNFARIVQDWESRDALPAPFNLFTVPAHVLVFALSTGKDMFGGCFERLIICWNWMVNCWNTRYANLPDPETKTGNDEDESNEKDKTLRMLHKNIQKNWFGSKAHLERVKALTADYLQAKCGEFEDIATMIDKAILKMKKQQEDNQKELIKKVEDVKKDIKDIKDAVKGGRPTVQATLKSR